MSGTLLLWITLALSVFWSVGVYNRVMRLRARGWGALGSVVKHMRAYADLVRLHVTECGAANTPIAASSSDSSANDAWGQLLLALQALDSALVDATPASLMQRGLQTQLGQVFDALQNAWRRINEVPSDLAGPLVPPAMQQQCELAAQRVATARTGFNQLLQSYNEALDQFPARLVVRTMGFQPGSIL